MLKLIIVSQLLHLITASCITPLIPYEYSYISDVLGIIRSPIAIFPAELSSTCNQFLTTGSCCNASALNTINSQTANDISNSDNTINTIFSSQYSTFQYMKTAGVTNTTNQTLINNITSNLNNIANTLTKYHQDVIFQARICLTTLYKVWSSLLCLPCDPYAYRNVTTNKYGFQLLVISNSTAEKVRSDCGQYLYKSYMFSAMLSDTYRSMSNVYEGYTQPINTTSMQIDHNAFPAVPCSDLSSCEDFAANNYLGNDLKVNFGLVGSFNALDYYTNKNSRTGYSINKQGYKLDSYGDLTNIASSISFSFWNTIAPKLDTSDSNEAIVLNLLTIFVLMFAYL